MNNKIKTFIVLLFLVLSQFTYTHAITGSYNNMTEISNLLLIGMDKQENYNFYILLTIDNHNNKLTLTSFKNLKNSKNKDVIIDYIEDKQNINIENYVIMNRIALKKIINCVDGIYIEKNLLYGDDVLFYLDNYKPLNDISLINTHMNIIQEIIYSLSRISFFKYPQIISQTYDYISINITPYKMLDLAFNALKLNSFRAHKKIYD